MFFLCVNIIKIKKINKVNDVLALTVIVFDVSSNIFDTIGFATCLITYMTNTVRDANIDDNEEYLNINETTNQVNMNKKLN